MKNISVLVSGGGTNLQAVIDNVENGFIENAKIVQVIASKEDAYALTRAKNHNIKGVYIGKKNYPVMSERTDAIIRALDEEKTDLVILAGYMSVLEPKLIEAYRNKIINIHPSLIPKYCGKGFTDILFMKPSSPAVRRNRARQFTLWMKAWIRERYSFRKRFRFCRTIRRIHYLHGCWR